MKMSFYLLGRFVGQSIVASTGPTDFERAFGALVDVLGLHPLADITAVACCINRFPQIVVMKAERANGRVSLVLSCWGNFFLLDCFLGQNDLNSSRTGRSVSCLHIRLSVVQQRGRIDGMVLG